MLVDSVPWPRIVFLPSFVKVMLVHTVSKGNVHRKYDILDYLIKTAVVGVKM